jgi:Putative auto-transporter adhesin, head GIN domain
MQRIVHKNGRRIGGKDQAELSCIFVDILLQIKRPVMKQFRFFSAFALFCMLATACVAQKGENTSADRQVSDFHTLNVSGGFGASKLVYGTPGVKIITEAKWLPYIITENKGDDLNIYIKKGAPRGIVATLEVTFRELHELNNSGSTDFTSSDVIKAKTFTFNYSGSGDFSGEIEVDKLEINVSGSSDFSLRGNARKQEYSISGSGDIQADELKGDEAEVAISGSGDVSLHVGSVESSTSGSGRVRNRN